LTDEETLASNLALVSRRHPTERETWVMKMVDLSAERSRDLSTKVGCVITSPDSVIVSNGWNDFPRGVDDTLDNRRLRPLKYLWTEHAERNAIYNAGRSGVSLRGCHMYLRWFSCCDCARAAIQAGISRILCTEPDWYDPNWGYQFRQSITMLNQAGVEVVFFEK
jgi:dCMP deaminase